MSVNAGYDQYLRRYRLIITSTQTVNVVKSIKSINTQPAVPAVASSTAYTGVVTTKSLYFRAGPGMNYKSYGTLKKGATVEIIEKTGKWYHIRHAKGKDGTAYAHGDHIKITGEQPTTVAQETAVPAGIEYETRQRSMEITDLRCTFTCEKAVSDTPNYSVITVYNLSADNIASIKAGDTVILEAGYVNGNYGLIFTGQIVQPYVSREDNTDTALNLVVQDGDAYLNSGFVMTTLAACTQADVVAACTAGNSDITNGILSGALNTAQLPRGKVLFGKSSDYVRQAANTCDTQFYVEDGKVNVVAATDYASNQAVELNEGTGLIGTPSQTDDGISGECLINPSIKLNTLVHVRPALVQQAKVAEGKTEYTAVNTDGIYKIIKLTYAGDTHGDEWYCKFEAIAQPGLTPSAMNADVTNIWR